MMAAVLTLVLLAAPSEAVSRAHFAKAQKSFTQHDWRHALDEFTAASESAPSELPDLWFDIAQCHRNLGHQRQAAAAFTRYLALAPEAPDRDKVRSLILSLGAALLGGVSFAALGRAGRVEELEEGAIARADSLFRWDRHPWCPEIF